MKDLSKLLRAVVLSTSLGVFVHLGGAGAQPTPVHRSQEELRDRYAQLLQRRWPHEAAVERWLTAQFGRYLMPFQREALVAAGAEVVRHPALPDALARILARSHDTSLTADEANAEVGTAITTALFNGFTRLSPGQQEHVLVFLMSLTPYLPANECTGQGLDAPLNEETERLLTNQFLGLAPEPFISLVNVMRDAALAEIAQVPAAPAPTPEQAQQASRAHRAMLDRLLRAKYPPDKLKSFADEPGSIRGRDACDLASLDIQAALALESPHKERSIAAYIQRYDVRLAPLRRPQ